MRTLATLREVFGDNHQVFIAFELTKKFETHYRGSVEQVMDQLAAKSEGSRLKGEITMVVAPGTSEEQEIKNIAKGTGFNPSRDSIQKVNAIELAKSLESKIEMADEDFRDVLKSVFPEMPSYHIDALVAIAKKGERKPNTMDRVSKMVGGIM